MSGSVVKNSPANAGDDVDLGSIPGLEKSLEKDITTHSRILTWKILCTEAPGRLQSWSCRVGHNLATEHIQMVQNK